MKKLKIIPVKTQSILVLIYMAIASIYLNLQCARLIYSALNPETNGEKAVSVITGLLVFLILCAFIGGVFVKSELQEIQKKIEKEEEF